MKILSLAVTLTILILAFFKQQTQMKLLPRNLLEMVKQQHLVWYV